MHGFWLNRHWPIDSTGYVFMARALLEIGRARFGDQWTGSEYEIEIPRALDSKLSDRLGDRLHARNILKEHRPDIDLEKADSGSKHHLPTAPITQDQWKIAFDIVKQQLAALKPALARGATVNAEFAKQCEAGHLVTFYRATKGGEMHAIPRAWWNTESFNRFTMCLLNPSDPFGLGFAGDGYAWIFVSRESLDRYLCRQPFAMPAVDMQCHLSPYLRLMLLVSKQLDITVEHQPKKEIVIDALERAWPESLPRSKNLLDAMATLLREPASQLGRGRK